MKIILKKKKKIAMNHFKNEILHAHYTLPCRKSQYVVQNNAFNSWSPTAQDKASETLCYLLLTSFLLSPAAPLIQTRKALANSLRKNTGFWMISKKMINRDLNFTRVLHYFSWCEHVMLASLTETITNTWTNTWPYIQAEL